MGFGDVIKHGVMILFWLVIGLAIIIFAFILLYQGFLNGSMIIMIFACIIGGMGALVIWYFLNAHNIEVRPGYRTRRKYIDY